MEPVPTLAPSILLFTLLLLTATVLVEPLLSTRTNTPGSSVIPRHFAFKLTHRDAPHSIIRPPEADTPDLPHGVPMKDFISYGRALRARTRKTGAQRIMESVSYLGKPYGDFYVAVKVGTPTQDMIFLVDTGSELFWTQCSPCKFCMNTGAARFHPDYSSSFTPVPCSSSLCTRVSKMYSGGCLKESCTFKSAYADGSKNAGFISIENFTVGASSYKFMFGCSNSDIEAVLASAPGIMGLNKGPFSFAKQLLQHLAHKKFSYCLPDMFTSPHSSGALLFGKSPKLYSSMMYTPMVPALGPIAFQSYYVQILGVSVGNILLKIPETAFQLNQTSGHGGTIIDSGTTFSSFVDAAYLPLTKALWKATEHMEPLSSEPYGDVCFNISIFDSKLPDIPTVTLHFAGGADLELNSHSTLYAVGMVAGNSTLVCNAFTRSTRRFRKNVIGNFQQQSYWIEHDLSKSRIGFAKANCAVE
eukprot:c20551_g1_i3 orf=216-1631(-)